MRELFKKDLQELDIMKLILGGQTGEVSVACDSNDSGSTFAVAKKRLAMDCIQVFISPDALLPDSLEGITLRLKQLIPFSSYPMDHPEHGSLTRAVLLYVPKVTVLQNITNSGGNVNGEAIFSQFEGTVWHGARPWPEYMEHCPLTLKETDAVLTSLN
jgi:hypothetical protein